MRNRTMLVGSTAAIAGGSIGVAVASTTGAKPGAHAKTVPARLDQALREVKTSLIRTRANPTAGQFDAALARFLGIPESRVRRAIPVGNRVSSKVAAAPAQARRNQEAFIAAVARELHVTKARVGAALRPLFAAGRADTSSRQFAAAARLLRVSSQQLTTALEHAKRSLAGGQ